MRSHHLGVVVALFLVSQSLAHEGHLHTDPRAFGGIMPQLSPDGETLVFSYQGAIWKMPRGGGVMKRLTKEAGLDIEPAWSPDGKKIAYSSTKGFGAGTLKVIDSAGQQIPLPKDMTVMDKLHFDPKGERILGLFQPPNEKVRIAWYTLTTGELTTAIDEKTWPGHLPGAPGLARQRPALSHDGKWLAVNTVADMPEEQGGNNGPQNELWKVPILGTGGDNSAKPQLIARWPARIHEMCWRADDQAVLVVTERGGVHNDIWEVPLENGEVGAKKLTFGQADEDSPSFSADGKWLAYSENRFGPTMLVVRDLKQLDEQIVKPNPKLDWSAPEGDVSIQITEGPRSGLVPARVVIQEVDGKFVAPPGSLYRMLNGDLHFYTGGDLHLELPSGVYALKVFRGPEYKPAISKFSVTTAEVTGVHVKLERWTNQRADGWVGGENHIHANYGYGQWYNSPATMREQVAGEDLTVANFMVANSDSDGVFDREYFLGRPDPLSTDANVLFWNQEFRATIWGHMTLLNLKQLVTPIFTGFKNTTHPYDFPTNAHIADHTHDQGGLVNYTHPYHSLQDPYATAYSAKEMPIDVALGKIDTLDVMGSNHQATYPVWYRLLNCGLKIPASAGTDVFLNRVNSRLPGSDRVYVHCGEKFTYQSWIDNLRAGKTFVTNGPMLRFTAGGQEAGATLKFDKPGKLHVQGEVTSQYPLEKLEVIVSGQSLLTIPAQPENPRKITLDQEIDIKTSSWLALRTRGPRVEYQASSESFAHTSPIYVELKDQPLRSPADAKYFITWIERLHADIRKRNRIPAGQQAVVEKQLAEALEFYKKQAE